MSGNLQKRLREAIEKRDFRKAKVFLRNGAQTDKVLEDDISVIHFLCGINRKEANQLLRECLQNGASPNVPSCEGITPVHVAAIWGLYDVLCTLIEYGGDVHTRDFDGMSPLDYAEQSKESQADLCVNLLKNLTHKCKSLKEITSNGTQGSKCVEFQEGACSFDASSDKNYKTGKKDNCAEEMRGRNNIWQNRNGCKNENLWNTDSTEHKIYTKVKGNTSSCRVNVNQDCKESSSLDHNVNRKKCKPTSMNARPQLFFSNPYGQYYINKSNLLTDDEASLLSINQSYRDNDSVLSIDTSNIVNPRQYMDGLEPQPLLSKPDKGYYIDGREFLTDDESISQSLMSVNSSSGFHTANESEISMAFVSALDNTVVSFPKLHPWTATQSKADFEDTIANGLSNMEIENTSNTLNNTVNISLDKSIKDTFSDGTVLYDWKEYSILDIPTSSGDSEVSFAIPDSLLSMGCQKLREELLKLGDDPGPIRSDTRMLYVRRLGRIQSGLTDMKESDKLKEYLPEVRAVIEGRLPSPEMDPVEDSMCVEFIKQDMKRKWREGTEKSCFTYLLLDPRVTQNLPVRSKRMAYEDIFHTFVAAVFYVGKGKRARPYAHLHEALNLNKTNRKLQQIRDIWSSGLGIVSVHCFQGVIPVEAYTREACLVEALGLSRLTNQKKCDYYGRAKLWSLKKKRQMGVYLLKRALQIFLNEGERQMRPEDLRRPK